MFNARDEGFIGFRLKLPLRWIPVLCLNLSHTLGNSMQSGGSNHAFQQCRTRHGAGLAARA